MSKSWLVGLPVSVTLEDDGSVTVWVDMAEAGVSANDADFDPASAAECAAIDEAVAANRVKYEEF